MVYGRLFEPLIGMAHALSRTERLKVGTGVSVLPGRHPVLVAKQLASLAGLAPGRVLPVFGLRPARRNERDLFPVPAGQMAAVFDESLELLRLLLRHDTVSGAATGGIPEGLIATGGERGPEGDPASLVAASWPDARRMIGPYMAEGLSKFVIRPAGPLPSADRFLGQFVTEMMPLQT